MATSAFITYGTFSFLGISGYPVPSVSISKDYQRNGAGQAIGLSTTVTMEGKIFSGSGNSGINQLLTLESGLRNTFVDGKTLLIGCGTSTSIFSGGKISRYSASRTEDNWTTTIDYSIDLLFETNIPVSGGQVFYVNSTQDEWNIETLDETSFARGNLGIGTFIKSLNNSNLNFGQAESYPFYRISRTIGAVGKFVPTDPSGGGISAVENAKKWVNYHLSGSPAYSGIVDGLKLYNFVRSLNTSENEGSFRVTDNWLGVPSTVSIPFIETFTIESSVDSTLLRTVTINGNIKGLEPFNSGNIYNTTSAPYLSGDLTKTISPLHNSNTKLNTASGTKFYNAMSGYSGIRDILYDRAKSAGGSGDLGFNGYNLYSNLRSRSIYQSSPLHPVPYSITEGMNPAEGSVTYSWTYNNRPLSLITGSISETLSVDDRNATPLIASIFVLGRKLGPILQDLGTVTSSSRSVTFEVVLPKPSSLRDIVFPIDHYNTITNIVNSFDPTNLALNTTANQGMKAFPTTDTSNWSLTEGRFVRTKAWEWVRCIEG